MGLTNVTLFPQHFVLCSVTLGKQCTLLSIVVSLFYSFNNIFHNTKSRQFGPERKQQQHVDAKVAMAVTLLNLPEDSDSAVETLSLSMIICNNVPSHKTSFSQLLASSPKEVV